MRLRDLPSSNLEERRALKPTRGDVVKYNGVEYVMTEVGNRWAKGFAKDLGSKEWPEMIPLSMVVKTGERVELD